MDIYLICAAILVVLYFALSINVSRLRAATKTGVGPGALPAGPLGKAVRAHGNAGEYIPLFVALFGYFDLTRPGSWIAWVAVAVTIARALHAMGILMSTSFDGPPHPLRLIGAAGTYGGGLIFGAALLLQAGLWRG